MKKKTLLVLATISSMLTLFAASDYLVIYNSEGVMGKVAVDEISAVQFDENSETPECGEAEQEVHISSLLHYCSDDYPMSEITKIEYQHGLPAGPLSLEVTPHHMCATFHITSSDPNAYYRYGMIRQDLVSGLYMDEIEQYIFTYEKAMLDYLAEQAGGSITDYTNDEVFYQGENTLDCFPPTVTEEVLMPGSDYYAYAYTASIESDGVKFSEAPVIVPFTAKSLTLEDAQFDITANLTSISMQASVTCEPAETPFHIMAFEKSTVESEGLQSLVSTQLSSLEQTVYYGSGNWSDYVKYGTGVKSVQPLYAGEEVVIAAVGCEYGIQTTEIATQTFTVPLPTVVDDCTFAVTTDAESASQVTLNVTPSKEDTRYVVLLDEAANIDDVEYYVARKNYFYTYTNQVLWGSEDNDVHINTGAKSFDSKTDVLNGQFLTADVPYSFLIYGVDEEGARTTAVTRFDYTPTAKADAEKLTFEIEFGAFSEPWSWERNQYVTVTPSDPDAKYVMNTYTSSNTWLSKSDEAFISDWVKLEGKYLELHTGVYSGNLEYTNWGSWGTEMFFVFGYDGAATSDLYLFTINWDTGEVTQLRPNQIEN